MPFWVFISLNFNGAFKLKGFCLAIVRGMESEVIGFFTFFHLLSYIAGSWQCFVKQLIMKQCFAIAYGLMVRLSSLLSDIVRTWQRGVHEMRDVLKIISFFSYESYEDFFQICFI